jgi:hypothetical protein
MLLRVVAPLFIAAALLSTCTRSTESQLVGKWRVSDGTVDGKRIWQNVSFRADHTCIREGGFGDQAAPMRSGQWHAEGDQLTVTWRPILPDAPNTEIKARILKLTNDTLTIRLAKFDHDDSNDARSWNTTCKRLE